MHSSDLQDAECFSYEITCHLDMLRETVPLLHRFEVEGQAVSSELVIEALSMQLMDERAGRFERVRTG